MLTTICYSLPEEEGGGAEGREVAEAGGGREEKGRGELEACKAPAQRAVSETAVNVVVATKACEQRLEALCTCRLAHGYGRQGLKR